MRERFSFIKLRKIVRTPIASRRLERIPETLVSICADATGDDPRNSFGSADSVKNNDYYRTRNIEGRYRMRLGERKSEGFVLRRLCRAFESSDS